MSNKQFVVLSCVITALLVFLLVVPVGVMLWRIALVPLP